MTPEQLGKAQALPTKDVNKIKTLLPLDLMDMGGKADQLTPEEHGTRLETI